MGSLTQPPFERVAIVGLGLIGGSIALAIRRRWPSVVLTAVDRPHVLDVALKMRVVDGGGDRLDAIGEPQLVMLAAPVLQNVAALKALPDHLDTAVVTDAGSTKRAMAEAAGALPERIQFIGGHPLAGAAASGVEAARPDLFDDRPWILTTSDRTSPPALAALTQLVTGIRAVPQLMDADEHDRLLAYLSHLPQLAVSALMHVVGTETGPHGLSLAGRGLRDTTRLATSPAQTWSDIAATNSDNIAAAIDDLIAALELLKSRTQAPPPQLERIFVSAARWKGVLEHG